MLSNIRFFTQVAIFGHGQEGQVEVQTLPPDPYTPKFDPFPSIYLMASWKASDLTILIGSKRCWSLCLRKCMATVCHPVG